MTHYRIIGWIWLLLGVSGLVVNAIEGVRLLRIGEPLIDGATLSTLIGFGFFALATLISVGLLRGKRWARILFGIVGAMLGLYCLCFLALVGLEFGAFSYALCWFGLTFAAYTFTVVVTCNPQKPGGG